MTVVQLTSHLDVGGITRYVLSLSQRLVQRGHRVIVASDGGHCEADVKVLGLTHWRLPLHTSAEWSPQVFHAGRALAQRLRQEPVDLVHAHTRVGQVVADRLSRHLGIPYVTTWHGIFKRRLGRRLWPCTGESTIAISQPVRQHVMQDFHVPPDRVRCIYNGIETSYYATPPNPALVDAFRARWRISPAHRVIGSVGRMAAGRVKGFDLILMAAALLEDTIPELAIVLVGDGPRRPFLEDVAKRLGIEQRVRFVGPSDDIRVPLAVMDVFVFPSRWPEGFGLTLIEAMAAGKSVVGTRMGAVSEIIEHGRSGWLVPPEDPSALADGIAHLLRDRATASQLGRQAQARVREAFNLERMVNEIEAVYRKVVARSRRSETEA